MDNMHASWNARVLRVGLPTCDINTFLLIKIEVILEKNKIIKVQMLKMTYQLSRKQIYTFARTNRGLA